MSRLVACISGSNAVKLSRRRFLHLAAGAIALPPIAGIARAQTYPTRPVRAVVAFAPGGVTDTSARLMAQKLTEQLGKQVYVESIAGASGNIGTGQVAKAAPDGYTILFAFSSHVVNPTTWSRARPRSSRPASWPRSDVGKGDPGRQHHAAVIPALAAGHSIKSSSANGPVARRGYRAALQPSP
jgi:Tripartite tricarboxylate transporter family receptor